MIFLAFIIPVAIYCLMLSLLNRARHPVLVAGPWDVAGMLFGASGFLLLGGPAILTGFYEEWRLAWLLGQTHYLNGVAEDWSFWISLWVLYFAFILVGCTFLLWRRRNQTAVYNIEPATLEDVLAGVLDRLGFEAVRLGPGRFLLRVPQALADGSGGLSVAQVVGVPAADAVRPEPTPQLARHGELGGRSASPAPHPEAELTLDPFPILYHVTLRWVDATGIIRREVEAELTRALAEVWTPANPVAGFFLYLSGMLFFLTCLVSLALLVLRILHLPR